MEIGIGLDQRLGLSFSEHSQLMAEAARLGYESAWTPAGLTRDAFQTCAQWWGASAEATGLGMTTGTGVVPVQYWSPPALAVVAGTMGELTGGRFILGIGSGNAHDPRDHQRLGLATVPPIALMRDYLITVRKLLAGELVDYEGPGVTLHGVQLGFRPPRVPVYLGALGPHMLRLAGELADGVSLNWCAPEQVAWSRHEVAEGARRAGRDPADVRIVEYIRVCIDDDVEAARRAFTQSMLSYALARPGVPKRFSYRGHFARMGFDAALNDLEDRRDRGASQDELVEACPRELLAESGYYGRAEGAPEAFRRLAEGLDVAIVRVVASRPGPEAVAKTIRAFRPELIL